jgi:hypothetical protein
LNFNGEGYHNTSFGGCSSILLKMAFFTYLGWMLSKSIGYNYDLSLTDVSFNDLEANNVTNLIDTGLTLFWNLNK